MNGMVNPNMMNPSMRGMMSMNNGMSMGGPMGMQGHAMQQGYSQGQAMGMGQFSGMGYHGSQMQMQGGMSMQGMGPQHMSNLGRMQMMQGMGPGRPQMMGPGMGPQNLSNMPIRAGGPSINMRMPIDPHGRMFSGQGRPSPYPNPAMYMAQKRHQAPMGYNQAQMGQMGMSPNGGGQYITRGPFPGGPQGGYPMSHPHNMGGGPGPGFSGMPPGMHSRPGMSGPGGMPMSSMPGQFPGQGGGHMGPQNPGMRPGGPGGSGGHPSGGAPGGYPSPGSFPSPSRVKTEVPSVSPRGGSMSSFQHSPVPGNPTPPLTPNGPGNCISAPFASPSR